ncbi:crotonase/enoyl-CoA hydratase family protein [Conexibacter sp. DBS9H8]|uniref:crotonase/enoyl-CoA hydratase family protein n=1 Tax=Conexibacter sp. DBS9H8 TaxID=2937801 RepID=UPI00200FC664|nr:crotonase/enoyl-CoA hydratase family protein [Conexibacter sp. DBS9H8]
MPSPPEAVTVDRDGAVWTVSLHRPARRNAVDGPTAAALADAFRAFDADPEAAVAVLWGAGGTFCAGADLQEVGGARSNAVHDVGAGDGPMGPTRMALTKPVIAAIEGYAVAGGLELALWCDLRVAATDTSLGVFCRRWGVPLIDGGTVRLPAIVGYGRALELILSGREVTAAEAEAIGLVNRLVPPGETLGAAQAWAAQLAALPQTCLRSDRAAMRAAWGAADEAEALALELTHGRAALAAMAAGVQRFRDGAGRHGGEAPASG